MSCLAHGEESLVGAVGVRAVTKGMCRSLAARQCGARRMSTHLNLKQLNAIYRMVPTFLGEFNRNDLGAHWRQVRHKKQKACFFFFFFFFLQIAVTLGLDTKGDSNVTGNWRFIACIDIYNLRATSTADPIRRARARRKARLLGVFVVEKNCCTNAR
jgi:hypothetical protein